MKVNIVGDIFEIEGNWYKVVPEHSDPEDSNNCQGCAFEEDGNKICNILTGSMFGDRRDLFCGVQSIIYKLTDTTKGKKKLLIL